MKKRIAYIALGLSLILAVCGTLSVVTIHNNAYFSPDYDKLKLDPILAKDALTDEDYNTLFVQTGLGRYAIDSLRNDPNRANVIKKYQDQIFAKHGIYCVKEAVTTYHEYAVNENGAYAAFEIFPCEAGFVLIMESSHSFGWRHGHAGIALDNKYTLEAPMIGRSAGKYTVSSWRHYPRFMMLRLKDSTADELKALAKNAEKLILGAKYDLLAGVFTKESGQKRPQSVQCAYLVWYAFYLSGINIDKNGGAIVTVQDIINLDMFEIVQLWGYDPRDFL